MKKLIAIILSLVMTLSFTACQSEEPAPAADIDVAALGADFAENGVFEDFMTESTKDVFGLLYQGANLDSVSEVALYISSGATAEEIMVAKCVDEAAAKELFAVAEARVEYLKVSFDNYVPKELPKLENPVLTQNGVYVILCVSNDDAKADEILNSHLG